MSNKEDVLSDMDGAISVMFDAAVKYGDTESKLRASVVASGLIFFRMVSEMVKPDEQEDFISKVYMMAQEGKNAPEQSDPKVSKDNGSPGEGPEEGS